MFRLLFLLTSGPAATLVKHCPVDKGVGASSANCQASWTLGRPDDDSKQAANITHDKMVARRLGANEDSVPCLGKMHYYHTAPDSKLCRTPCPNNASRES